jgi:hypothetical protein
MIPLLGPGVDSSVLRGPIVELHALSCDSRDNLEKMLDSIATHGDFKRRSPSDYSAAIAAVLDVKALMVGPENTERVLEFFRANPDVRFQPGVVAAELDLTKGIVREIAEKLASDGQLKRMFGQYGRIYQLAR